MFESAARAYEHDVDHAADVERDEDTAVHVMLSGRWHRRKPNLSATACGVSFHGQFANLRREELRHPLSRECGCFTPDELGDADRLIAQEYEEP